MLFLCKYVFVRECRATHIVIQYSGLFPGIKFCLAVFPEVHRSRCLGLNLGFISPSGFAVFRADRQFLVADMNLFVVDMQLLICLQNKIISFWYKFTRSMTLLKQIRYKKLHTRYEIWYETEIQTQTSAKDTLVYSVHIAIWITR